MTKKQTNSALAKAIRVEARTRGLKVNPSEPAIWAAAKAALSVGASMEQAAVAALPKPEVAITIAPEANAPAHKGGNPFGHRPNGQFRSRMEALNLEALAELAALAEVACPTCSDTTEHVHTEAELRALVSA